MKNLLVFLALILALSACTENSSIVSPVDSTPLIVVNDNPLIQLSVGTVWTYRVSKESGSELITLKVDSKDYEIVLDKNGNQIKIERYYVINANSNETIYIYKAYSDRVEREPVVTMFNYYDNGLRRTFPNKIEEGYEETVSNFKWVGKQTVSVEAGVFDAWLCEKTTEENVMIREWYSEGFGLVKMERLQILIGVVDLIWELNNINLEN